MTLEKQGKVAEAIALLRHGVSLTRTPAALYNRLALVLVNVRRDYREAQGLLELAVRLQPEKAVYRLNLEKVSALAAAAGP